MATVTRTVEPKSVGSAILDQFANLEVRSLSPATARELLDIQFDATQRARVKDLSAKAREGRLSDAEERELDEYLHVADLLAILHSKARQAMRKADQDA
jgi:hypothetical protein